jgi:excisionase family DNA binding protein
MAEVDRRRDYVNVREAARLLGVHENTIRNWVDDGRLSARRLPGSGYRRILVASIQRILDEESRG